LGLWSHGPAKGPSLVFEDDAENDGDDQEASDMQFQDGSELGSIPPGKRGQFLQLHSRMLPRLDKACPIPETSDEGRPHHPFAACRKRRWGTTFPPPPQEAMDLEQLQDDDVHASPAAPQEAMDLEHEPRAKRARHSTSLDEDSMQFENDSEQEASDLDHDTPMNNGPTSLCVTVGEAQQDDASESLNSDCIITHRRRFFSS
jgi:hypothetical protein